MSHLQPRLSFALLAIGLCAGCGEKPQRIGQGERKPALPARFAGNVHLEGALAQAQSGSLFLIVREPGSRVPSLTRKYEIGDPAFSVQDDVRVLHFALDERDNMGGVAVPMADDMEIEARFDPDGIVDTSEGVVRAAVHARPGEREISIVVRPAPNSSSARPIVGTQKGS